MSMQFGRKCQKQLQFDRFLQAVGQAKDERLQREFDASFKRLMSLRQKRANMESTEVCDWRGGMHVPPKPANLGRR